MKKLILLVIILISTISIKAEILSYTTQSISIDYLDGYGYRAWEPCNVYLTINFDAEQIVIYSKKTQIFDIETYSSIEYKDYTLMSFYVNDSNYTNCYLKIFVYKSGSIYMKLEYNNIIYKYKLQ